MCTRISLLLDFSFPQAYQIPRKEVENFQGNCLTAINGNNSKNKSLKIHSYCQDRWKS